MQICIFSTLITRVPHTLATGQWTDHSTCNLSRRPAWHC